MLFDFIVRTDAPLTDAQSDQLYSLESGDVPGFESLLEGTESGGGFIDVCCNANSLGEAISFSLNTIEGIGVRPVAVDESDSVTISQIADRTGYSLSAVEAFISGTEGPGRFPQPTCVGGYYSWKAVADWFARSLGVTDLPYNSDAALIGAASHLLRANALSEANTLAPVLKTIFGDVVAY